MELNKLSGIYKIENIKNNKIYIGSSKDIKKRWKQHISLLNKDLHHSYKLQRDWKEFGENSFVLEVIDEIKNEKELKEFEQYWLDTLQPHKTGYNILGFSGRDDNKTDIQKWNDKNGGFIFLMFLYGQGLFERLDEMLQEDIFKLIYVSTFLEYDSTLKINREKMKDLLGLSRNAFDIFFNKMKKIELFKDEEKTITINNQYISKGVLQKYIKQYNDFTRVYINTIRYLYENVPIRKHRQIGSFLKLIPYAHRETNILCWNPISNIEEIKFITLKDFVDILGYSRSNIPKFCNTLRDVKLENGEYIISFIESKIIINPRVTYGGNFDIEGGKDTILKWFQVNKK